jgi:predicted permease
MQAILSISLPFFGLVFCGFAARRSNLLPESAVVGLNAFVFWFALPALLFYKLATTPAVGDFDFRLILAYSGAGLVCYAAAVLIGRTLFRARLGECGIQGMAAAYPNVGYMGLPLVIQIWGDAALAPAIMILITDTLLLFSLTTLLLEADTGKPTSLYATLKRVARGLARNPLLIAALLGIAWWQLALPLPLPVASLLGLLAAAAAPCALFALGATLVGQPISGDKKEVATLVVLKLAAHPVLAGLFAGLLALDPFLVRLAVVEASLPSAANVFVLATAYGRAPRRASSVVLISTAVAVVTVSIAVAFAVPDTGGTSIPINGTN